MYVLPRSHAGQTTAAVPNNRFPGFNNCATSALPNKFCGPLTVCGLSQSNVLTGMGRGSFRSGRSIFQRTTVHLISLATASESLINSNAGDLGYTKRSDTSGWRVAAISLLSIQRRTSGSVSIKQAPMTTPIAVFSNENPDL